MLSFKCTLLVTFSKTNYSKEVMDLISSHLINKAEVKFTSTIKRKKKKFKYWIKGIKKEEGRNNLVNYLLLIKLLIKSD